MHTCEISSRLSHDLNFTTFFISPSTVEARRSSDSLDFLMKWLFLEESSLGSGVKFKWLVKICSAFWTYSREIVWQLFIIPWSCFLWHNGFAHNHLNLHKMISFVKAATNYSLNYMVLIYRHHHWRSSANKK